MEISSGRPYGAVKTEMSFKQYATNMPMMAQGRTLPKSTIHVGVFLFSPKIRKGRKRVVIVTRTITAIKMTSCIFSPPSRLFHNGKQYGNQCHGRNQKQLFAENQQTQNSGG